MTTTHTAAAAARAAAAQDRRELRAALTTELVGYERRGLTARADGVRAQIAALTDESENPDPTPVVVDETPADGAAPESTTDGVPTTEDGASSDDQPAPEPEPEPEPASRGRGRGRASAAAQD